MCLPTLYSMYVYVCGYNVLFMYMYLYTRTVPRWSVYEQLGGVEEKSCTTFNTYMYLLEYFAIIEFIAVVDGQLIL